MKRTGAGVPSANRITLLRDHDGDGVAEARSTFLDGLNSPFGMASGRRRVLHRRCRRSIPLSLCRRREPHRRSGHQGHRSSRRFDQPSLDEELDCQRGWNATLRRRRVKQQCRRKRHRRRARARGDLESHTTVAVWDGDCLTLYDSTQGVHVVRTTLASIFGLEPDQVRVIAPHVGGGFGSKGTPHAHEVLVRRAAKMVGGHAVKFALTRQQMFSVVGYRTPTIQRIRLGADRGGTLTAIVHDVIEQTSRFREFAEQTEEVRNSCRSCTFTVSPKATSSWRFEGCSAKGRRRFRLLRSNG